MPISPYIHFQGNCREAMNAYHTILGGDLTLSPYATTPGAPPAFAQSNLIYHSALMTSFGELMASDFPPGVGGDAQAGMKVSLETADLADGQRIFYALSNHGAVIQDFSPSYFSPGFGMLKDRFGTHWIVMVTPRPAI